MPRLLQTASHYEALKCFLHGFLAVAGVHPDLAENAPFDLSRLSAADREHANQVAMDVDIHRPNTVEDYHTGMTTCCCFFGGKDTRLHNCSWQCCICWLPAYSSHHSPV